MSEEFRFEYVVRALDSAGNLVLSATAYTLDRAEGAAKEWLFEYEEVDRVEILSRAENEAQVISRAAIDASIKNEPESVQVKAVNSDLYAMALYASKNTGTQPNPLAPALSIIQTATRDQLTELTNAIQMRMDGL
jgi:hypothetical protein